MSCKWFLFMKMPFLFNIFCLIILNKWYFITITYWESLMLLQMFLWTFKYVSRVKYWAQTYVHPKTKLEVNYFIAVSFLSALITLPEFCFLFSGTKVAYIWSCNNEHTNSYLFWILCGLNIYLHTSFLWI